MRRNHTPEGCCEGKESLSSTQARRIARTMRRKDRGRLQPYHCPGCGFWHVGSTSGHIEDKRRDVEKRAEEGGDDVRP
jgi:predicted Zn-ribbon and HTH transcriptional regulator